jgi:hypothetical protein
VSLRWRERRFQADSGEGAVHVSGDFAQKGAITPILFLAPAVLEDNTDDIAGTSKLIQKGKVLLGNSPHLLTALQKERSWFAESDAKSSLFSRWEGVVELRGISVEKVPIRFFTAHIQEELGLRPSITFGRIH